MNQFLTRARSWWRAEIFAWQKFRPHELNNSVLVPDYVPVHIKQYVEYLAKILCAELPNRQLRRRVFLAFSKHIEFLPKRSQKLLIQHEQTIFTGDDATLSSDALAAMRSDTACSDVIEGVRIHGPVAGFDKADAILDYSAANITHVKQSPLAHLYAGKSFHLAPMFPNSPRNLEPRAQPAVHTMYGSPDAGRRSLITKLITDAGITVTNISNYHDYDLAFRDAAILVNFRQVEYFSTPEELRILPALLQRVIVITEDTEALAQSSLAPFVIRANRNDVVTVTRSIIDDYVKVWKSIFSSGLFEQFIAQSEQNNQRNIQQILGVKR